MISVNIKPLSVGSLSARLVSVGGHIKLSLCALALSLWWAPAFGQTADPRILLIFDTSGSMGVDIETNLEVGGDNSREYPGDGEIGRAHV